MEITCSRCHQAVQADNCFCPTCGLPQLIYAAESSRTGASRALDRHGARRQHSRLEAGHARRIALAVPAGFLCSLFLLAFFGLFWMAAAAAWAVVLYVRSQRPAWITVGAGARIGLVTGLLGVDGAAPSGVTLFVQRLLHHQGQTRR